MSLLATEMESKLSECLTALEQRVKKKRKRRSNKGDDQDDDSSDELAGSDEDEGTVMI